MSACQLGRTADGCLPGPIDRFPKRLILLGCMLGHWSGSDHPGPRRQLLDDSALLSREWSGLGRAGPTDHRIASGLLRSLKLRTNHGLVLDGDDDLHDRRFVGRRRAHARRDRRLHDLASLSSASARARGSSGWRWPAVPGLAQVMAAARQLTPPSAQLIAVSRPNRPAGD